MKIRYLVALVIFVVLVIVAGLMSGCGPLIYTSGEHPIARDSKQCEWIDSPTGTYKFCRVLPGNIGE